MTMTTDDHLHVILTRDGRVRGSYLFDTVEAAVSFAAKEFVHDEEHRLTSRFEFVVFAAGPNVTNFVYSAKYIGYVDWEHDDDEEICSITVRVIPEHAMDVVAHEVTFTPDDYDCTHPVVSVVTAALGNRVTAYCDRCGARTTDFEKSETPDGAGTWYGLDEEYWKPIWA